MNLVVAVGEDAGGGEVGWNRAERESLSEGEGGDQDEAEAHGDGNTLGG